MTEALTRPVACSRMYNLSPTIRGLWDDFFGWLSLESGIGLEIIAHAAPASLSELWSRPDMGAVFMCGYPFSMMASEERPIPLAAPVSIEAWARGGPFYASQIVTTRNAAIGPDELASARWGWTVHDSQSGYHAPRAFLAGRPDGHPVRDTVGPLLNPRGIIDAILDGRIEVGAIDAYAYQLLAMHEPQTVSALKVITTTESTPVPLLVTARQQPEDITSALRIALLRAGTNREASRVLQPLGLSAFVMPDMAAYDRLPERARQADGVLGGSW